MSNLINRNQGFINLGRSTVPDNNIINNDPTGDISHNLYWFLVNWSSQSEFIRDQKPRSNDGRGKGYLNLFSVALNEYRNNLWTSLEEYMNNRIPLDETTEALRQSTIQILLGKIWSESSNCQNKRNKRKRDLQNNYWNNKFCDLKPEINAIKGTITAIKILDKNKNNNSENWEIYLGTTIRLYS